MAVNFVKNPTDADLQKRRGNQVRNFIKPPKVDHEAEAKRLAEEEAQLAQERADFEAMKAQEKSKVEEVAKPKRKYARKALNA